MKVLDGKIVRDKIAEGLAKKVAGFDKKPKLAIVQVGHLPESDIYIGQKKIWAEKMGIEVLHEIVDEKTSEENFIKKIKELNSDKSVHGIIVQLPIPQKFDQYKIIESIDPVKDVDGLTSENVKKLLNNVLGGHVPATAKGIITLLDYYKIPISGKKAVIVGRSNLVGKPSVLCFLNRDATVSVCHKKTKKLSEEIKNADIIVVAVGSAKLIKKNFVKKGQIIIDVGINSVKGTHKAVGDVDFENVKKIVKAVSPVPGGVGPMTVVTLFQNLVDAYLKLEKYDLPQ